MTTKRANAMLRRLRTVPRGGAAEASDADPRRRLAGGTPEAQLTRDAKAALGRVRE